MPAPRRARAIPSSQTGMSTTTIALPRVGLKGLGGTTICHLSACREAPCPDFVMVPQRLRLMVA